MNQYWNQQTVTTLEGFTFLYKSKTCIIQGDNELYPADRQIKGRYKPMLLMEPGDVYFPHTQKAVLFLIVCDDDGGRGACVYIKQLTVDGNLCKGPLKISQALNITTHGTKGKMVRNSRDEWELIITEVPPGK